MSGRLTIPENLSVEELTRILNDRLDEIEQTQGALGGRLDDKDKSDEELKRIARRRAGAGNSRAGARPEPLPGAAGGAEAGVVSIPENFIATLLERGGNYGWLFEFDKPSGSANLWEFQQATWTDDDLALSHGDVDNTDAEKNWSGSLGSTWEDWLVSGFWPRPTDASKFARLRMRSIDSSTGVTSAWVEYPSLATDSIEITAYTGTYVPPDPAGVPTSPALTIVDAGNEYYINSGWASGAGGTTDFEVRAFMWRDAAKTENDIDSDDAKNFIVLGGTDELFLSSGPFGKPIDGKKYCEIQVRAKNAANEYSAWSVSSTLEEIADIPGFEVTIPDQPDGTGWAVTLGQSSASVQTGEQKQQVLVTITRDMTANGNYWRAFYFVGETSPAILTDWIYGPAIESIYPADTIISDIWIPRTLASQTVHVALTASSYVYTQPPTATMPVKSVTVEALADAPAPIAWDVVAQRQPTAQAGSYFGRFLFAEIHSASPNIAGVDVQRKPFGSEDSAYMPLSAYQSKDPQTLQAGGTYLWDQGTYDWPWPDAEEKWVFRCGLTNHRGKTTWHSTTITLTLSASSGWQVSALIGKLQSPLGISGNQVALTGNVPGTQVVNIPAASIAAGLQFVSDVTATPDSNGDLIIVRLTTVVRNTTDNQMYRWDSVTSRYKRKVGSGDIYANSISSATMIAGAIGTRELATVEILVGAGGGKPPRFKVMDALGNMIAFIGDDSGGFVGGYFSRLRVAPSFYSTQRIEATAAGVAIENVPLYISGSSYTTAINTADGVKVTNNSDFSYAKLDATGLTASQSSFSRYTLLGWGGIQLVDAPSVRSSILQYSGLSVMGPYANPSVSYTMYGMSSASSGSYVNLQGYGSYLRADKMQWGQVYNETIPLAGITVLKYIPAYDLYGGWLGKIPIIP